MTLKPYSFNLQKNSVQWNSLLTLLIQLGLQQSILIFTDLPAKKLHQKVKKQMFSPR